MALDKQDKESLKTLLGEKGRFEAFGEGWRYHGGFDGRVTKVSDDEITIKVNSIPSFP